MSNKVRCDGVDDCGDLADELNCQSAACNATSQFTCNSKQCIPLMELCDGRFILGTVLIISGQKYCDAIIISS